MRVLTACTNRLGNRSNNQDRFLVQIRNGSALLAVADGMGGHPRGDLAAQVAIDSLRDTFLRQRSAIENPRAFLNSALESAHLDVIDAGRSEQPPADPRTTVVTCLVQGDRAWWAHVGDSRLYLLRGDRILLRTRDHTPVEELRQSGVIDDEQLRAHPLRNSVSRCLGGTPRLPVISFDHASLQADDMLLLCSDGFWSAVPEAKLAGLRDHGELEAAVNHLADEAEVASYPQSDNITLVCMRWLSAHRRGDKPQPSGSKAHEPDDTANARDPVQQAIDEIHRAMLEYAAEMKK